MIADKPIREQVHRVLTALNETDPLSREFTNGVESLQGLLTIENWIAANAPKSEPVHPGVDTSVWEEPEQKQEKPEPQPEPEPQMPIPDLAEVRAALVEAKQGGADLAAIFKEFGAAKLSEVKTSDYAKLLAKAKEAVA